MFLLILSVWDKVPHGILSARNMSKGEALDQTENGSSCVDRVDSRSIRLSSTHVALIGSYNGCDLTAWDASKASDRDPTMER